MTTWLPLAVAGFALTALIVLGYVRRWRWIGVAEVPKEERADEPVQRAKTLWDWLQLLVIPLVLAALGFLLTTSQNDREQRREDQRAALQRSTAAEAAREEALSAYFRQMSALLLDRELLTSRPRTAVRTLARTITHGLLRRLDGDRKASVVRFLYEGGLLERPDPKVLLGDADLAGVNLRETNLAGADFRFGNLEGADLRAHLVQADLRWANLEGADLREATLEGANLQGANLEGADLRGAILLQAKLRRARLRGADYDAKTVWPAYFDPQAAGASPVG